MTTAEFLSHLRSLDVKLWVEGERLRCNAPKAVLTPELRAELEDRKQDILDFLRQTNGAAFSTVPSLQPVSRDCDLPLSFAQQRLWFLDQLEPHSALYNLPTTVHLSGLLNVEALQKALQIIVSRHEILRTIFATVDGVPTQVIAEDRSIELQVNDLNHWSVSKRDEEVRRLLKEESSRPFNLSSDLKLRATLLKLEREEHILLLVMHHIASDGWSMGVLYRELAALYETFATGKPSSLPELPIQYADFAIWQRQWLQGEVLESQVRYWKKQLADAPAVLELPTDRPRPPVQSYRGAWESLWISEAGSEGLKALSRREGVTLFMTLLAAFKVLLHRYTGQDDIVVGSPVASRNRLEIEPLIGFFVNNLVLRTDLSGDPSFSELLSRVRQTALGGYGHQDLPFEKLVEELQPKRTLDHHPLFQVVFAFENDPGQAPDLAGLTTRPLGVQNDTAKFDLTLFMTNTGKELIATLEYNTDLFDRTTISRMLGHFQTLLQSIVANPGQRLSDLSILTNAEKQQLLVEWNDTEKDYPKDQCIHQVFEAVVERTPDAIAVVFEEQQLTYRQLNARANQVAHFLTKHGVGPEVSVGICVERSLEMVVGLLGVLKAGAAYVPLDPDYPQERLSFMIEDAQVPVLLTEERFRGQFLGCHAKVTCIDSDAERIAQESEQSPRTDTSTDSLAYIIYTSGSSGRPKGVEVRHRGVLRLLLGVDYVQLDRAQTFLHLAPISFDAATFEVWGALLHGGKCVLFPGKVPSPRELGEVLKNHRVNTLWLTAALFNTVINEEPQALSDVKQLVIGGEALSVPHVRKGLAQLTNTEIINGYGPTESTTFTCCYRIPRELDEGLSSIPIGRPIGNTQVYILDSHLNPVPIGVAGELHIGGDGLAQGYLNRPELTAEKFIVNPFSNDCAARLYKTGDRARYLADGNIEFLGRIDNQVKIRGFRIELGEVEAVLAQHPAIRETVVLAREDSPRDKRLIAYVVSNQQLSPTKNELRGYLREKLPEYMVPSAFVMIESLPLTPNGKVDRRALLALIRFADSGDHYVAPRTAIEAVLSEIWGEILKVERVSIHDNFFDLGGHSLLGSRLIEKVCREFRIEFPLRWLFECPTVESMEVRIAKTRMDTFLNRREQSVWRYLFDFKPGKSHRPVFFLPGGFGGDYEFLVYARLVHYAGDDYGFYGLRARSADGTKKAHTTVEEIASDYLREMQVLQPDGPYSLIGNCIGGIVAYEIARQLEAHGQKVALLVLMDTWRPTLKSYLRYRAKRFKQRVQDFWRARYLSLRDNYYIARTRHHFARMRESAWNEQVGYLISKTRVAIGETPNLLSSLVTTQFDAGSDHVREGYIDTLLRYRPRPYQGRVVMLNNETAGGDDPTLGWKNFVRGGIDVHTIPGNHDSYIRQYVRFAGEKLRECLDKASSENSPSRSQTGNSEYVDFEPKSVARLGT